MPAAKKAKKRNPQDLTLRNLRAIKARLAKLELRVRRLENGAPHDERWLNHG